MVISDFMGFHGDVIGFCVVSAKLVAVACFIGGHSMLFEGVA